MRRRCKRKSRAERAMLLAASGGARRPNLGAAGAKEEGKKKRKRRNKEGRAGERERIFETEENEGNKDGAGDGC